MRRPPVPATAAADDLDALPVLGQKREASPPGCVGLVAGDDALDAADEQIEPAVAVEIDERRDVLAIEEDRPAVGVLQRAAGLEARLRLRARVAIEADVAERQLAQQVQVAVGVEIDEAVPLADVEILIAIRAPL